MNRQQPNSPDSAAPPTGTDRHPFAIDRRRLIAGGAALGAGLAATQAGTASAETTETRHGPGRRPLIGRAGRGQLHVMSFNIRYDRSDDTEPGDPDHWPDRAPILTDFLRIERPTLLGVQEALYRQFFAIEEALPRHQLIGYGRDGGSNGEYSAIFYDPRVLEALEWDQFWLSDTPKLIGSASWGNEVTRIVTWCRFRDRRDDTEFVHVNTHFDHQSENARVLSAEAIVDLLGGPLSGLPLIVTGDFNATAGDSGAYATMVESGPLVDTWDAADRRLTPAWGTFPGYEDPVEGGDRIDWVLATDDIDVAETAINVYRQHGRYPSDHAPVQALIEL